MLLVEDRVFERNRENLVRSKRRVVAVLAIDDVVEIAAGRVPEAAIEGSARLVGVGDELIGFGVLRFAQLIRQQAECIVPERVNLDRFAAARGHHPIADFGIHPGSTRDPPPPV